MGTGSEQEPPRLAVLAAEVYEERSDPREAFDALLSARVYRQRPQQPGFMAVGDSTVDSGTHGDSNGR